MTDPIEADVSRTLAQRAEQLPAVPGPAMADGAIRRGRLRRRRHRLAGGVAAAFVLVAAAPVVAGSLGDRPSSVVVQPAAPATPAPVSPAPVSPRTTPCALIDGPPDDVERDTFLDADAGILEVWYRDAGGIDRHYAIDYRNDPTCGQNARLRALIEHVLASDSAP